MTASELRFGNLLTDEKGKVFSISGYGIYQACLLQQASLPLEGYNPIPLTEEWLIRFGFEKLPHFTVSNSYNKDIGRGSVLSVSDVGTPNFMVWIFERENEKDFSDIICLHNWDYDKDLYVHQLQNLIYALTNTELTLNEL